MKRLVTAAAGMGFTAIVVTADHPTDYIVDRFLPHFITTPGIPVRIRCCACINLIPFLISNPHQRCCCGFAVFAHGLCRSSRFRT